MKGNNPYNRPNTGDEREREIGRLQKVAITTWLFTGIFGLIIMVSATSPAGLYLAWFLWFITIMITIFYMIWWIASKTDVFLRKKLE